MICVRRSPKSSFGEAQVTDPQRVANNDLCLEISKIKFWRSTARRPNHLLQTTALINEAYIRLIGWKNVRWQNRAHFFGVSAVLCDRSSSMQRELSVALNAAEPLAIPH